MDILTIYIIGVLLIAGSITYDLIEREMRISFAVFLGALVLVILMLVPHVLQFAPPPSL